MLSTSIEAEDELKHRMLANRLSPDRYKYLLLATGVSESEAETARARLELELLQSKVKK